jgi:hypothetical protein
LNSWSVAVRSCVDMEGASDGVDNYR